MISQHWKFMFPLNKMKTVCAWTTSADFAVSRPTSDQIQDNFKEERWKGGRKGGKERKEAKPTWTYGQGVWISLKMWVRCGEENYITHHTAKLPRYSPETSLLFLPVPWVNGLCLSYSSPHPTLLDYSVGNLVTLGTTFPRLHFSEWFWVQGA